MKTSQEISHLKMLGIVTQSLMSYTIASIGLGYFLVWKWNFPKGIIAIFALLGMTLAFIRIYQIGKKELR